MSIERKIDLIQNEILNTYKQRLNSFELLCESPIEKLFLLNFINYYESKFSDLIQLTFVFDIPEITAEGYLFPPNPKNFFVSDQLGYVSPYGIEVKNGNFWDILLIPQYEIALSVAKYRVDFFLRITRSDKSEMKICIECDGYDFHQKTRQQVDNDNLRDRELISNGYIVFRYSGSELYAKGEKNSFKELMLQIEKIAIHDLVEKERTETIKLFEKYAKENNLNQEQKENLKKQWGIFF